MGRGRLTLPGSEPPRRDLQHPDTLPRPGSARSPVGAPEQLHQQSWMPRAAGRRRLASLGGHL